MLHELGVAASKKALAVLMALTTILSTSVTRAFAASGVSSTTPIKHVVVIFQENVSFDHYFATYPKAEVSQRFTPAAGRRALMG